MADVTIKRNDTWPPLKAVLADDAGPINLAAAASVTLKMRSSTVLVSAGSAVITNAAGGEVTYYWKAASVGPPAVPADTGFVGIYNVEWEITWSAGGVQTVPNSGYSTVEIVADLDGALGS
jgi:hypothetical protein